MKKVILGSLVLMFSVSILSAASITTEDGIEYEEVCEISQGCAVDDNGVCPDCVLKRKWDIEIVRDVVPIKVERRVDKSLKNGKFAGRYQVTHAENTEGFFSIWEKGVYLDISKLGKKLYLVNVNGIGKINGKKVDCSDPPIFSMELDSNGKMLNRKDIYKGSCPISVFVPDTRWILSPEGLKKVKKWSINRENGKRWTCVVGPCDFLKDMTHIFYYKRVK